MISFFLFLLSSILIIYPNKKNNEQLSKYGLVFFAILLAYYLTGFTSLILVIGNLSRFPILIISMITFLSLSKFNIKNTFSRIKDILFFLLDETKSELKKIKENKKEKMILIIYSTFILLIFFSSIGPINHPDATDYHVGYPYQYFLQGRFIIDGGLHQGLLGIGDYANLAFIQENSIWLIRPLQILSLPLLILFLSKNIKNKILIFLILSCPVLIQWSTIGKPIFLHESSLAALFLIWENNKNYRNTKLLLLVMICSIGIKISSLIIILPIFCYLLFELIIKNKFKFFISEIIFDKLFLFILCSLGLILYSRFIITGNLFYPLLTDIFNRDNIQINDFADYLKSYGRKNLFPINIFVPLSKNSITLSLGIPITIFFAISTLTLTRKNLLIPNLALLQIFLLLIFCQGRGDYYFVPLFLLIYSSNSLSEYFQIKKFANIFNIFIILQSIAFLFFTSISISQNIKAATDYEFNISKNSYGYTESQYMYENESFNTLFNGRNTRFYYGKNYIDRDIFDNCLTNKKLDSNKNNKEFCLNKYKINRIITTTAYEDKWKLSKENFNCIDKYATYGSRNPFNRRKVKIEICDKN